MYTKVDKKKFSISNEEIEGYIDESDIFGSSLLYNISLNPFATREAYTIKTKEFRPDLVAKDYYGDVKYESYVILQAGGIENIYPGNTIYLLTSSSLKGLRER